MTTPQTPRNWSDLDPYLKPVHLNSKIHTVTVERIELTTVHPRPGKAEIKPVMHFAGKSKGLILTSTNQKFLRATFGDDISASYGKSVTLMPIIKTVAGKEIVTILIGVVQ